MAEATAEMDKNHLLSTESQTILPPDKSLIIQSQQLTQKERATQARKQNLAKGRETLKKKRLEEQRMLDEQFAAKHLEAIHSLISSPMEHLNSGSKVEKEVNNLEIPQDSTVQNQPQEDINDKSGTQKYQDYTLICMELLYNFIFNFILNPVFIFITFCGFCFYTVFNPDFKKLIPSYFSYFYPKQTISTTTQQITSETISKHAEEESIQIRKEVSPQIPIQRSRYDNIRITY